MVGFALLPGASSGILSAAAFFFLASLLYSQEPPPYVTAPIAIVADAETGTILMEKNADRPVSPASLAKLMTLHLTAQMDEGTIVSVPAEGSAQAMRPGSSVVGLEPGDRVTIGTLRRAAAVVSAGDAAWTLAILHSGDIATFVDAMNRRAALLGMNNTTYSDPDGWSSVSSTTGRDQMTLSVAYIQAHKEELSHLHAPPFMTYTEDDDLTREPKKPNTNLLLGEYEGLDGLKTGTLPSSGFHFAATAERSATRFIAIVMGVLDVDYISSVNRRADEARLLLEWAFTNYRTWHPSLTEVEKSVPVKHGAVESVSIRPRTEPMPITLPRRENRPVVLMTEIHSEIIAPVSEGQKLGTLRWYDDSRLLSEIPLIAETDVEWHWRMTHALGLR
ncbi:MAG: D-alanyl-D-alanine carboxypeptidase [Spirochaetaceae bacterium]|nr:D-alanyl-D-alanine carboxypeptidase [Spirochaetaceae bacterium]